MNLNNSKVIILTFNNDIKGHINEFISKKDYVIINTNNRNNRYADYFQNEHHFTTKFHRDVILPVLSNLLNFEFNINDFHLFKNIIKSDEKYYDLSYLVPNDNNYRFDITGLEYDIHYESDFSGLLYSEKYKDLLSQTGLITKYHQLYAFPHSCSIVKNLYKNNGRTLLVSGDSQSIPYIPALCTIFKEVWYFDNRSNKSFKKLLENKQFTDILIQMHKQSLDYYTNNNLK